jgi:hypothetical protein
MSAAMPTIVLDKSRSTMVVSIPVAFAQRGGRKRIVVPVGVDDWLPRSATPSNAIIAAVAKAHHWRTLLENGEFCSAAEVAKASKVNESYLCRVLRLTLLAPDIAEAILDGRQPSTLELSDLLKPFPLDWQAQRKLWDFSPTD